MEKSGTKMYEVRGKELIQLAYRGSNNLIFEFIALQNEMIDENWRRTHIFFYMFWMFIEFSIKKHRLT